MEGKWVLMPSLRVATFSHLNKLGDDVLVETDLKTKLCRHGETSSTIRNWLQSEATARAEGRAVPKRPSVCDCEHTHGLQNTVATRPPTPPTSVYDVLAANEAPSMDVGEAEPALRLGERGVFLAASGSLFCSHRALLVPATKGVRPYAFKAKRATCKCTITLPRRAPRVCLGRV